MSSSSNIAVAVRWFIVLMEPLVTMRQRTAIEADFRHVAEAASNLFMRYCAPVLVGITASLPTKNPWRKVAISHDDLGIASTIRDDGLPLGSHHDSSDVIQPVEEPEATGIDPFTLALHDGPHPGAPEPVVTSFTGWSDTCESLVDTNTRLGPDEMFEVTTSAIRWSEHRRRSYRPGDFDSWFESLSIECAQIAQDSYDLGGADDIASRFVQIGRGAEKERNLLDQVVANRRLFA